MGYVVPLVVAHYFINIVVGDGDDYQYLVFLIGIWLI
jgi:hypothetical protein